jgi:hypothetical protein
VTPAFSQALGALQPQQKGRGWIARCPAHEDSSPSLRIDEADDKIILYCHAGCSFENVVAAMGLTVADTFDTPLTPNEPQAKYDYHDADGNLVYQVWRWGKTHQPPFTMHRPDGTMGIGEIERVPYRLHKLLDANRVLIVEGEKDADRLAAAGLAATTSPNGAGKWRDEYAKWFEGKDVVILPDNDEPGTKHGMQVEASLRGVARRVRIINLEDLPPKGDVSDWLNAGHTIEELGAIIDDKRLLKYERMGDIAVVEDAPMALEPFILDEGPCLIFGDGGTGKSALVMALAASFATGQQILPGGPPTITGPVMWLDYESQRMESARRLHRLGTPDAPILYVPGIRAIHEDVDRLTAIAEAEGVGLVVVDSVVLAVGGSVSPNDAESPTLYARAVSAIAPRSIGLAHVVKANEADERKPFGSGFWHNVARLTWHIKKDESVPGHNVILTCRKRTGGEPFGRLSLTFDWADGGLRLVDGPAAVTVADQIERILAAESPLSASTIGARMLPSRSGEHVRSELKRHPDRFAYEPDAQGIYKWRLL